MPEIRTYYMVSARAVGTGRLMAEQKNFVCQPRGGRIGALFVPGLRRGKAHLAL